MLLEPNEWSSLPRAWQTEESNTVNSEWMDSLDEGDEHIPMEMEETLISCKVIGSTSEHVYISERC